MPRIGVLGGGESGVGAAILAKEKGYDVFLSDSGSIVKNRKIELIDYKVDFEEGQHTFEKLVNTESVVKSPGIPGDLALISELKANGVEIISEVEWAFRHANSRILAITGSNGKTTTTRLCHHLAVEAGIDAVAVGNVGPSVSRFVAKESHDWLVLEVSSFQLDDIKTFRPEIAIILNITPDHLDRYQDFGAYAQAKWRIAENQDESENLILIDSPILRDLEASTPVRAKVSRIQTEDCRPGRVVLGEKVIEYNNSNLRGPHNAQNVAAALYALQLMGQEPDELIPALNSFVNDPHRLEEVVTWRGIRVVNDSKATNVDSTEKALMSFEGPIIWIAGGTDKGNDYTQIRDLVREKVIALVMLGADNEKLNDFFEGNVDDLVDTNKVEEAVKSAFDFARDGSTILFSPACASFDLFTNYVERGNIFKQTVKEYISSIE